MHIDGWLITTDINGLVEKRPKQYWGSLTIMIEKTLPLVIAGNVIIARIFIITAKVSLRAIASEY